jgi:hypothetical protein
LAPPPTTNLWVRPAGASSSHVEVSLPGSTSQTPGDLVGKWAIGSLLADFGEKGGHDNESAALTACCRTLRALEDQTLLRGTPSHNTVICLPRTALRLLAGLVIPTPAQTRILTIARQKWVEIRAAAAATLPPRHIWLAGPDHGPRGIRARALARQGFISPLGNVIDTTMPPRILNPWKDTSTECYVCFDDFGDMLPDPHDPSSRITPFLCPLNQRHGVCWGCGLRMFTHHNPCGLCRAHPDPDDCGPFPFS